MENNIYRSMLPLSICCLVFGFSTVQFKQTNLNKTVKVYCWLVTIFGFMSWCVSFVWKVLQDEKYNFNGILYVIVDVVRIMSLTYYRIKYNKHPNVFSDILENINFVDQNLQNAGIKVQHVRNLILCTLYTVINMSVHLTVSYSILFINTNLLNTFNTIQEFVSLYNILVKFFTYYSFLLFLMHCIHSVQHRRKAATYPFDE